jgi:hypothetical protein
MELKEEILKLFNEYAVQENSSTLDTVIEKKYFNELAEEVVKIISFKPPVIGSVCTCRNSELEKGSLVPVFCHTCNAYVQTDL